MRLTVECLDSGLRSPMFKGRCLVPAGLAVDSSPFNPLHATDSPHGERQESRQGRAMMSVG